MQRERNLPQMATTHNNWGWASQSHGCRNTSTWAVFHWFPRSIKQGAGLEAEHLGLKLTPIRQYWHYRLWFNPLCHNLPLLQLPVNASGKAVWDAPTTWAPASPEQTRMQFLAPDPDHLFRVREYLSPFKKISQVFKNKEIRKNIPDHVVLSKTFHSLGTLQFRTLTTIIKVFTLWS